MPKFFDEISPIGEDFYDEIDDLHEGSKEIPNKERSQIKEGNTYDIPLVY